MRYLDYSSYYGFRFYACVFLPRLLYVIPSFAEALEELQIPPYKEEEVGESTGEMEGTGSGATSDEPSTASTTATTTTTAVATESTDTTASSVPAPASSPAESAASPASCSSKDSGVSNVILPSHFVLLYCNEETKLYTDH